MPEKILNHPRLIAISIAIITVFFSFQLPKVRLDNDVASFIPKNHPTYLAKLKTDEIFGEDLALSAALKARDGTFFTAGNLRLIIDLTKKLEEIPDVGSVTSLTTTDFIEETDDGIRIAPILDPESFEGSRQEIEEVKRKLLAWAPYDRTLYSRGFEAVQILVTLERGLSAEKREKVYFETERIVRESVHPDIEYHIAGIPAIAVLISMNMRTDLATLIPLVILVVLVSLFLSFRRLDGVLFPTVTVLISTIWTVGLMALLGISLSMVATVIPVLMIAVGSAYGIHLVNHYYDEINDSPRDLDNTDLKKILVKTLVVVGRPVLLAGLTTMAGFGSLATSRVLPMRYFGIFTSFGVFAALVTALTLIPSLILLRGSFPKRRVPRPPNQEKSQKRDPAFFGLYRFLRGGGRCVILASVFLAGICLPGIRGLVIDNALVEYFKENTTIRRSDTFLRDFFSGTRNFSVIVTGTEKGALTDPRILASMDGLSRHLTDTYPEVSKVLSFSDFIKRMNHAMHADPEFDEIPFDPEKYGLDDLEELKNLISQYLLLYSGSMEKWADDSLEPMTARMLVQMNAAGNKFTRIIVQDIERYAEQNFPPGYTAEFSGIVLIENTLMDLIVDAQLGSILVSLCIVFIILAVNFKSLAAGIIGIIPLSLSIAVNFAVMGFFGIRLDITTAMVASVAIGIGIDYTIHFMSRYSLYRKESSGPDLAVRGTLQSAGKAIVVNAVSVGAGFAVLLLSQFNPLMYFGALIALTMFTSSVGAMTILPAVLGFFNPRFAGK
jgi:hydrophobe/amphiphile efflux-3 (HAE3) family protein